MLVPLGRSSGLPGDHGVATVATVGVATTSGLPGDHGNYGVATVRNFDNGCIHGCIMILDHSNHGSHKTSIFRGSMRILRLIEFEREYLSREVLLLSRVC